MGAATVTHYEWGYQVTGDTGVVTIDEGTILVKSLAFAGNADDATAALTSIRAGAAGSCAKFKCSTSDLDIGKNNIFLGDRGVPFTGLAVTLSHGSDVLYVYLTR